MSNKNKLTLEEILKLKRSERPTQVEWSNFDDQLKRRLLRTIVERRGVSVGGFLGIVNAKVGLAVVGAAAVLIAAIIPFSGLTSEIRTETDISIATTLCTPLPKLPTTFADNIIASDATLSEIPVNAPMNFGVDSEVRFVSTGVPNAVITSY